MFRVRGRVVPLVQKFAVFLLVLVLFILTTSFKNSAHAEIDTHYIDLTRVINLGTVEQTLNLSTQPGTRPTGSIELGRDGYPTALYWTYTKKVTKKPADALLGEPDHLEGTSQDYFTTFAGSGLGAPELVSVTHLESNTQVNPQTSSNNFDDEQNVRIMSSLKATLDINQLQTGTYQYIIKTPITEYRNNYVFDTNARLEATFRAGQLVNVNGQVQTVPNDQVLTSDGNIRGVFERRANPDFKVSDEYLHPEDAIDSEGNYIAGEYSIKQDLEGNDINWYLSYTNKKLATVRKTLNTALDSSQNHDQNGNYVYVFRPGANGYEVKTSEKNGTNPTTTKDVALSEVVFVRRKTWTMKNSEQNLNTDHTCGTGDLVAKLPSMRKKVEIKRVWDGSVTEDQKYNATFQITAPDQQTSTVTIAKADDLGVDPNAFRKRFLPVTDDVHIPAQGRWKRINWQVKQVDFPENGYLARSTFDPVNLKYRFTDGYWVAPNVQDQSPDGDICERYGVLAIGGIAQSGTEVSLIELSDGINMNQYEYYPNPNNKSEYGDNPFYVGTGIAGRFRIPARAQSGDNFTMIVPEQLVFNGQIYNEEGYIGPIEAIFDGQRKNIGGMYASRKKIEGDRAAGTIDKILTIITFRLNQNAYWPNSYEGDFYIGRRLLGTDEVENNKVGKAATYRIKSVNDEPISDETARSTYVIEEGFIPGIDCYDPADPFPAQTYKLNLPIQTAYNNQRQQINGDCATASKEPITLTINGYVGNTYINQKTGLLNKYVINEGVDENGTPYITFRLVWNAGMLQGNFQLKRPNPRDSRHSHFFDYLPLGMELLHGNNAQGLEKDIKVWNLAWGNISGVPDSNNFYMDSDAYIYPPGAAHAQGRATVSMIDIEPRYLSNALGIPDLVDEKGNFVPMGKKISIRVLESKAYDYTVQNNLDRKGYVLVADITTKNNIFFAGKTINTISSQQAELTGTPMKLRSLMYQPGIAYAGATTELAETNVRFTKKVLDAQTGQERAIRPGEKFGFKIEKLNDDSGFKQFDITEEDGMVVFNHLLDGEYIISELSHPGLSMDKATIKVVVERGRVVTFDGRAYDFDNPPVVVNKLNPRLKLVKVDSATGERLPGFQVKLTKLSEYDKPLDDSFLVGSEDGGSEIIPFGQGIDHAYYAIEETQAPAGYSPKQYADGSGVKTPFRYIVRVNADNTIDYTEDQSVLGAFKRLSQGADGFYELKIENEKNPQTPPTPQRVSLNVLKRDLYTKNPLAGAQFALFSDEEGTLADDGARITPETTSADGMFSLEFLEPGTTYYLREGGFPSGYNSYVNMITYKVVVSPQGQITIYKDDQLVFNSLYSNRFDIDNRRVIGELTVWKYLDEGQKVPLEGAEFALFTNPEATVPYLYAGQHLKRTSGKDGYLRFFGLRFNRTYYMKETITPPLCKPNNDIYEIEVDNIGRVTIKNAKTHELISDEFVDKTDVMKPVLKVKNERVNNSKNMIYIKKADASDMRNRIEFIRFNTIANRQNFGSIPQTIDFYPEYVDQAYDGAPGYIEGGINSNIPDLTASFELLHEDKTPFDPPRISKTLRSEKTNIPQTKNGNEIGNNYAEFEVDPGTYWIRETVQPNGYPSFNVKEYKIKVAKLPGNEFIQFVHPDTNDPVNTQNGYGTLDSNGLYEGYYLSSYNYVHDGSSIATQQQNRRTYNTLLLGNQKGTPVRVEKTDEEHRPLEGAQFTIDGTDPLEVQGTQFNFANLSEGYHTLEETRVPYNKQGLQEPVTFYKSSRGFVVIPAKKLTNDELQAIKQEQELAASRQGQAADKVRAAIQNIAMYTSIILPPPAEYEIDLHQAELEFEKQFLSKLEDRSEQGQNLARYFSVNYQMENGKYVLDDNGNLAQTTVSVVNTHIPITGLLFSQTPMVLTVLVSLASLGGLVFYRYYYKAYRTRFR